jgi:hypothetical protein
VITSLFLLGQDYSGSVEYRSSSFGNPAGSGIAE